MDEAVLGDFELTKEEIKYLEEPYEVKGIVGHQ